MAEKSKVAKTTRKNARFVNPQAASLSETFAATLIKRWRNKANCLGEIDMDGLQGWNESKPSPMVLVDAFPKLHVREGYVLRAYQFREGFNGNAFVYALPEDVPLPDPNTCERREDVFLEPPIVPGALDDYMQAIDGDGSLRSYIEASILARELAEFGAIWHGISWGEHIVLDADPFILDKKSPFRHYHQDDLKLWKWEKTKPDDWRPKVSRKGGTVTVMFYSFTDLSPMCIVRHVDRFKAGSYSFKPKETVLGYGPGGKCF